MNVFQGVLFSLIIACGLDAKPTPLSFGGKKNWLSGFVRHERLIISSSQSTQILDVAILDVSLPFPVSISKLHASTSSIDEARPSARGLTRLTCENRLVYESFADLRTNSQPKLPVFLVPLEDVTENDHWVYQLLAQLMASSNSTDRLHFALLLSVTSLSEDERSTSNAFDRVNASSCVMQFLSAEEQAYLPPGRYVDRLGNVLESQVRFVEVASRHDGISFQQEEALQIVASELLGDDEEDEGSTESTTEDCVSATASRLFHVLCMPDL